MIFCISLVEAKEMRVGAYNIKHGRGMDGKLDLDRQVKVIEGMKVELLALQEVDKHCQRSGNVDQAAYFAKALGMHHVFGKAIPLGKGEYGQAVLSKYPIVSSKVHRLPSVGEARIILEVVVEHPKFGQLSFCSVHYSFRSEEERFPQVMAFEKVVRGYRHPVILTGDFNARPETKTMAHYRKEWQVVEKRGDRLTSPADKPRSEIDYCVLRNFGEVEAVTEVVAEAMASDHRPLVTEIRKDAGSKE
ncbi:endonuclease/exonuclease/phosphatase family protein [Rubritalea tangerina]|uniref:Endonuclease/exonuclease/phosphatase family protein n=2 Tax=Rubritalea tangerina TaxID=430798 RepID=A0ABW4Z7J5_9BACT